MPYPNDSWTWNDFRAAAKKLTINKNGKTVQWGADIGYLSGWDGGWQTIAASDGMKTFLDRSSGKPKLNIEQKPVIDAWKFIADFAFKDKSAPSPAAERGFSQSGGAFASGKVAMVPDGSWSLGPYKTAVKRLGVARLPRGTTGKSIGPVWGTNMFIAKASKHPKQAYDFLRWWTVNRKAIVPFAKASGWCGAPIVKNLDPLVTSAWKGVYGGKACVDALEGAQNFWINTPNWPQATTNVLTPLWNDKFLAGKISAKELAKQLNDKLNAAL